MPTFSDFGLSEPLLRALRAEGYEQPTPIQAQAVPHVMQGRDLCGIAQTGTGKTAAFALPILHRLSAAPRRAPRRGCRTLVLSPTRELASQIADSFTAYGRHLALTNTVVFGGVSLGKQERAVAGGVDVVVATPGRLLDLVDRGSLTLSAVEILVLDEADQMLDLGFIHALKRIVKLLPAQRQTLFFSATMPASISALADQYLTDPVKVAVAPVATTAERVEQSVMFVPGPAKQRLLETVLRDPAIERTLVFTRTKHGADRVVRGLEKAGIEAAAIHGNKSQPQRERALGAFRDGTCRVLVATDIAARGIDVEGVSHVINFELPNVPESYVHRIGRTARAGAAGIALSFCNDEERAYLRDIERLTRLKVPVAPLPAGFTVDRAETVEPKIEERGRGRPASHGQPRRGGPERHAAERSGPGRGQPRHAGGGGQAAPAPKRAQQASHAAAHAAPRAARPAGGRTDGGAIAWLERGASGRRGPR